MKINIGIEYDERILRDDFNRENWDGFREEERYNHRAVVDPRDYHYSEKEFDVEQGKVYFLVYAVYFDGGTFGRTLGYTEIIGLYDSATIARGVVKLIEEGDKPEGMDYCPWEGYFAGLQHVKMDVIYT